MSTVQEVFDTAILLMDAQDPFQGSTDIAENKEYRLRTPGLLSTVLPRVTTALGLPPCPLLSKMEETIPLEENLCRGLLPFALAGLLLMEEDPGRANFFYQSFLEQLKDSGRLQKARWESVEDCYGGVDRREFGMW